MSKPIIIVLALMLLASNLLAAAFSQLQGSSDQVLPQNVQQRQQQALQQGQVQIQKANLKIRQIQQQSQQQSSGAGQFQQQSQQQSSGAGQFQQQSQRQTIIGGNLNIRINGQPFGGQGNGGRVDIIRIINNGQGIVVRDKRGDVRNVRLDDFAILDKQKLVAKYPDIRNALYIAICSHENWNAKMSRTEKQLDKLGQQLAIDLNAAPINPKFNPNAATRRRSSYYKEISKLDEFINHIKMYESYRKLRFDLNEVNEKLVKASQTIFINANAFPFRKNEVDELEAKRQKIIDKLIREYTEMRQLLKKEQLPEAVISAAVTDLASVDDKKSNNAIEVLRTHYEMLRNHQWYQLHYAWALATANDGNIQNGKESFKIASQAVMGYNDNPRFKIFAKLVLAAAHAQRASDWAEAGNLEAAERDYQAAKRNLKIIADDITTLRPKNGYWQSYFPKINDAVSLGKPFHIR